MTDEDRQKLIAALRSDILTLAMNYQAADEIERLAALAQSNVEPWRCPIGIAPQNHSICSAGTCWWCLSDRVKAQSDAEPVAWHNPVLWEACACLCEFTECEWAQKRAFSIYKRAMEVLPKLKALLDTAPPRPDHELSAIAAAIGSSRFMDPPDGGDVSLAEQVCRMREALERAEAALAQSDAEPKDVRKALIDARDNGLIYWEPITARGHTEKALMLARIDAALAQSNAGPNETYNRSLVAQADAAELASYKKLVYIIESEIKRRDQLQAAGEIYTAQSRPDALLHLMKLRRVWIEF